MLKRTSIKRILLTVSLATLFAACSHTKNPASSTIPGQQASNTQGKALDDFFKPSIAPEFDSSNTTLAKKIRGISVDAPQPGNVDTNGSIDIKATGPLTVWAYIAGLSDKVVLATMGDMKDLKKGESFVMAPNQSVEVQQALGGQLVVKATCVEDSCMQIGLLVYSYPVGGNGSIPSGRAQVAGYIFDKGQLVDSQVRTASVEEMSAMQVASAGK